MQLPQVGTPVNLTATANVCTKNCALLGFYVNSTNAGTVQLRKGGAAGTILGGVITPAIGWNPLPALCPDGLHATIGGTALDVTFIVQEMPA